MGSIRLNTTGRWHHYLAAKAAVNQMMRGMAAELLPRHHLHPAASAADGDEFAAAPLSVERNAVGSVNVIETATLKQSGRYVTWTGEELPW